MSRLISRNKKDITISYRLVNIHKPFVSSITCNFTVIFQSKLRYKPSSMSQILWLKKEVKRRVGYFWNWIYTRFYFGTFPQS